MAIASAFSALGICRHGMGTLVTYHSRKATTLRFCSALVSKEEHNCKHSSLAWQYIEALVEVIIFGIHVVQTACIPVVTCITGVRTKESVNKCQTPLMGGVWARD